MCECYKIGGSFIGADPDCEIHRKGGYEDRITELERTLYVTNDNLTVEMFNNRQLEAENAALREAARWRKWPEEKPDTSIEGSFKRYLVKTEKGYTLAGIAAERTGGEIYNFYSDGACVKATHWRPIDQPKEEDK